MVSPAKTTRNGVVSARSADLSDAPEVLTGLQPFQWHYRGLTFGEGTDILVDREVSGAWEIKTRSGDRNIPRGDGAIQGEDFASPTTLVLPLYILGARGSTELGQRLASVHQAFALTPGETHWLYVRTWNEEPIISYRGRVIQTKLRVDPGSYARGAHRYTIGFRMADPRKYDGEARSVAVPMFGSAGGGMNLPIEELPSDFDQSVQSTAWLTNEGNAMAWPVMQFQNSGPGDVTQVTLQNLTTGATFSWDGSSVPLAAGQTLVADMDALVRATPGPFVYIDSASRYAQWELPREPLGLAPGANQIALTTTGNDVTCRMTWRNTWL